MPSQRKSGPQLYGTKQVAEILGIPEWRVKNFTEGGAYGLPQPLTVGTGRGSRRLYDEKDVLRLAIANELVNCGFTPEAVGDAVGEIPQSRLKNWHVEEIEDLEEQDLARLVLTCREGSWHVERLYEVLDHLEHATWKGLFVLDFPGVLRKVLERMKAPDASSDVQAEGDKS